MREIEHGLEGRLGRRAEGRIKSVLARSPLSFYPHRDIGFKFEEIVTQFSNRAALIFEALMCCFGDFKQEIFESVDSTGIPVLLQTARQLAETPEAGGRIVFRTVFGASRDMPVGALSYLLPSVYLTEGLLALNQKKAVGLDSIQPPQIQFLFMNEAGVEMNGMERARVSEETKLFIEVAQAYLKEFHPGVLPHISFADDVGFTDRVMAIPLYHSLVAFLRENMMENARQELLSMAANHSSNSETAFSYAAFHPLVHDGMFMDGSVSFRQLAGVEPIRDLANVDLLISIGAQPEKFFYGVRQLSRPVLERQDSSFPLVNTIQYFTSMNTPPYVLLEGGDLSLREVIQYPNDLWTAIRDNSGLTEVHTPVRQAVDRLANDAGDFSVLSSFLREQNLV